VPISAGLFLMAAALLGLIITTSGAPIVVLSILTRPIGLGGALSMPPATALVVDSVPPERVGTASGVFNTCRQLGGTLAMAIFGALVAHRTFLTGLHVSLLIAAVLLLATALATLSLCATPRTSRSAAQSGFEAAA
jgi:MFS transporter, DHA2 family, methylenomycin A resistance protein